MHFMPKIKLSYRDRSNQEQHVTKTKQDNDVTEQTSTIHTENNIELSWPIESGCVYE